MVKAEPTVLYRDGFLPAAMRRERVTEEDIRQAARGRGKEDLGDVSVVILESDGTLSVLTTPTVA